MIKELENQNSTKQVRQTLKSSTTVNDFKPIKIKKKIKNKKKPGSVEESRVKLYKILLIISGIIVGVLAAVIISFIALLFLAVAYM